MRLETDATPFQMIIVHHPNITPSKMTSMVPFFASWSVMMDEW